VPTRSERVTDPLGRRLEVLHALRSVNTPLTTAQIAEQLGLHPNTVRFHLDILVENGQVECIPTDHRRPGRPPQLFRAVRGMDPTGPRRYQVLAEVLVEQLVEEPDAARRAAAAGRAWGRRLDLPPAAGGRAVDQQVDHLVSLLDDLGFAPERPGTGERGQIGLRHCPFLELSQTRASVVCPVHLGLMQGALEAWRASVTVERLDAFVEPDLCIAHLAPTG
jgi:predicted ArsR family transcriptional regulator